MEWGGCRKIFGGGTSITKSRRWRPQINGGSSAGARLYLKDCYPIRLLCLLLLFSSSGFSSHHLLHLFPSLPPPLLLFLFSSSSFPPPLFPPPPSALPPLRVFRL